MKIWTVRFDVAKYASAFVTEEDGLETTEFILNWPDFEGQSISNDWGKYKAQIKQNKPIANFTDIDPGILICDSYALLNIRDCLEKEVELLPIEISGLDMKVINIINVIDCLNEQLSDIEYYPDSSDVRRIRRYSFNENLLEDTFLFKIPQFSRTEIFCTDSFRDLFIRLKLTGLTFQLVYPL